LDGVAVLNSEMAPADKAHEAASLGHGAGDNHEMVSTGRLIPKACVDFRDAL
jgi:hypothetical protein